MSELLFIAHRFPYPPNKGEKIRAWHFLRHLAASRTVHLACLNDEPVAREHIRVVEDICSEVYVEPVEKSPLQWRNLQALATGLPITLSHHYRPGLAQWIGDLLGRRPVGTVLACSGAMAQYVPPLKDGSYMRIIDFVDVDSEKWRQYARRISSPKNRLYAREARVLEAYERRTAREFDASVFVSEAEASHFCGSVPDCRGKVVTIQNGVIANGFRPERDYPRPQDIDSDTLVFIGHMDYWPNIEAVTWFAREVFPLIRDRHPDTKFAIVGANPVHRVRRLGAQSGIQVIGTVDEVQPYLAHAGLVVVPLKASPGIANKILEAMAMAQPVVATSLAVSGLSRVKPGRDLLVADDRAEFADAVMRVLEDRNLASDLGQQARRCILAHYTWEESLKKLDRLLQNGPRSLAGR